MKLCKLKMDIKGRKTYYVNLLVYIIHLKVTGWPNLSHLTGDWV